MPRAAHYFLQPRYAPDAADTAAAAATPDARAAMSAMPLLAFAATPLMLLLLRSPAAAVPETCAAADASERDRLTRRRPPYADAARRRLITPLPIRRAQPRARRRHTRCQPRYAYAHAAADTRRTPR